MTQVCKLCRLPKPVTEFHRRGFFGNGKPRWQDRCKLCRQQVSLLRRAQEREVRNREDLLTVEHEKTCTICNKTKSITKFRQISTYRSGRPKYRGRCTKCANLDQTLRKYKLTMAEYKALGKYCRGCKTTKGRLTIDHNHVTGKVRGRLCANCNSALGFVKDDANVLDALSDYLRNNHERNLPR